MAYSDFTNITQVEKQFGIRQTLGSFFETIEPLQPSQHLQVDLDDVVKMPHINSEKAKSEFLIVPILKEVRHQTYWFSIFSGYTFDVDKDKSLVGICDYILSDNTDSLEIKSAVFCLVEAKNRTTIEGIPQLAAEMVAAQIFNAREQNDIDTIYGCVTTGTEWIFLKLQDKILTVDTKSYYITTHELPYLLGAFRQLLTSKT